MQPFKSLPVLVLSFGPLLSWAQFSLETPAAGATESGVGVISGYHCSSQNIAFKINGIDLGKAGAGTSRGDTQGLCGRADTGFSLLFNFNLLSPGAQNLSMYADGRLVESRNFFTTRSAGSEFLPGKSRSVLVPDFPKAGQSVRLDWVTGKQAFVITDSGELAKANFSCDMTSRLHGVWEMITDGSTLPAQRWTFDKAGMVRMADPQSEAPCSIAAGETNYFYTYGASYAPTSQSYLFMQIGTGTGTMYVLNPDSENPDRLKGYKTQFWIADYSPFGTQFPVTAVRVSSKANSSFAPNTPMGLANHLSSGAAKWSRR